MSAAMPGTLLGHCMSCLISLNPTIPGGGMIGLCGKDGEKERLHNLPKITQRDSLP